VGDEAIPVTDVDDEHLPVLGEHAYVAVDAGDGHDLSAARGRLAVVTVPANPAERATVTRRAADAGVAVLAFVDEARRFVTLNAGGPGIPETRWADVPVLAAAGDGATRLRAAAANGDALTVTVAASADVYDIVGPDASRVDPEPVVGRSEQRRLATISERFHRDPDGTGAIADRRYSDLNLMNLDSAGPLPERRTSHVSPGVPWTSMAMAPTIAELFGQRVELTAAVSMDNGRTYEPGSRHRVTWVSRPQWPGPVGDIPLGLSFCQPTPVARTADVLQVWLSGFQDRLDGFGCGSALEGSTLTLERDGQPVPERDEGDFPTPEAGEFPVPPGPADYRMTYQQVGQAPYVHRSTTTWTFRSAAPAGDDRALVPLLVVGYQLPLDTLNRPTGDTATLTVRQVTGAPESPVRRVRAWTSTDDGATWRPAPVEHGQGSEYRLRLPRAARGTGVSLRVAAGDAAGATIEQTLIDAYTA
jgi:hypothetical protein